MGAAAPTHNAVLPDRRLGFHRPIEGVGLQTSLERRVDRSAAGRHYGSAGGE